MCCFLVLLHSIFILSPVFFWLAGFWPPLLFFSTNRAAPPPSQTGWTATYLSTTNLLLLLPSLSHSLVSPSSFNINRWCYAHSCCHLFHCRKTSATRQECGRLLQVDVVSRIPTEKTNSRSASQTDDRQTTDTIFGRLGSSLRPVLAQSSLLQQLAPPFHYYRFFISFQSNVSVGVCACPADWDSLFHLYVCVRVWCPSSVQSE